MAKDWGVLVKKSTGKGWRRAAKGKAKNFTEKDATAVRNQIRAAGRKAKLVHDPQPRNWRVLVKRTDGKGWREASRRGKRWFTKSGAISLKSALQKKGREVRARQVLSQKTIDDRRIAKWLSGDLDCNRELLVRLSRVAEESGWKLHVNFGLRTYAEQKALWDKYGAPRAARPGTSRHETGLAADVVSNRLKWMNLGQIPGARKAMRKHGLGLPVPGESWHTEMTSVFNA